uniref:Uncharacterized protein n=1 Tax=Arundo donax TaxID=35708 RepID=A0A0A9BH19_ARUDO
MLIFRNYCYSSVFVPTYVCSHYDLNLCH